MYAFFFIKMFKKFPLFKIKFDNLHLMKIFDKHI